MLGHVVDKSVIAVVDIEVAVAEHHAPSLPGMIGHAAGQAPLQIGRHAKAADCARSPHRPVGREPIVERSTDDRVDEGFRVRDGLGRQYSGFEIQIRIDYPDAAPGERVNPVIGAAIDGVSRCLNI